VVSCRFSWDAAEEDVSLDDVLDGRSMCTQSNMTFLPPILTHPPQSSHKSFHDYSTIDFPIRLSQPPCHTERSRRFAVQGYILGNPTTDDTIDYMMAELYQGMSLIPEDLLHALQRASCPAHGHKRDIGGDPDHKTVELCKPGHLWKSDVRWQHTGADGT